MAIFKVTVVRKGHLSMPVFEVQTSRADPILLWLTGESFTITSPTVFVGLDHTDRRDIRAGEDDRSRELRVRLLHRRVPKKRRPGS